MQGRKQRIVLLAALVAAAVCAAIVVLFASLPRSSRGRGPLASSSQGPLAALIGGRVGIGQPTAVGKPMSISGDLILRNTSDDALVLDRVELVGLKDVTYLGAYIVPFPLHTTPFTAAFEYRVPADGRVLPGATLAPHTKAWVVVGLTPKRGRHQWARVDLWYHDGAAMYRRHVAIAGAVCAPFNKYLDHCHPPGWQ